jgi:molybdopterin synthase catalytic subunit
MIRVQQEAFDAAAELKALLELAPAPGAVASFVGVVRGTGDGEAVLALELESWPRFTLAIIAAIGEDAATRFGLAGLSIVHRHGRMAPGEPIVFVGAAAAHRRAAFQAVDYLMDRLKVEAPFWKREHGPEGSRWIEPRDSDRSDRARWDGEEVLRAGM